MGSFVSTPSGGGGGGGIPIIGGLLQLFGIGGGNQRQQFEDMARRVLAGHDPWAGQPVASQSGLHQNIVNDFYRMDAPEGTPDFLKWPDPSTGLPTWIAIKLREFSGQDPMSGKLDPSLIAAFKASGTSIPDSVRSTLGGAWDPSILDRLDLTRLVTLISTTFGIPMGDIQNQVDVYNQQQQTGTPPDRIDESGRPVFTGTGTTTEPSVITQPSTQPLPSPSTFPSIPFPPGIFDPGGLPQPSPPTVPQLPTGQPPDRTGPGGMPIFIATGTAPLPSPGGGGGTPTPTEPIPLPPPIAPMPPTPLPLPPITFPGFPLPPPGAAGPVPGTTPPGGTTPSIPGLPSGGPSLGGGGGMPAPYAPVVGGGNPLQSLFGGPQPQQPMVPNLSYFLRRS